MIWKKCGDFYLQDAYCCLASYVLENSNNLVWVAQRILYSLGSRSWWWSLECRLRKSKEMAIKAWVDLQLASFTDCKESVLDIILIHVSWLKFVNAKFLGIEMVCCSCTTTEVYGYSLRADMWNSMLKLHLRLVQTVCLFTLRKNWSL